MWITFWGKLSHSRHALIIADFRLYFKGFFGERPLAWQKTVDNFLSARDCVALGPAPQIVAGTNIHAWLFIHFMYLYSYFMLKIRFSFGEKEKNVFFRGEFSLPLGGGMLDKPPIVWYL